MAKNTEQDIKVIGCAFIVVVGLVAAGCGAVFRDDEPAAKTSHPAKSAAVRPSSASPSPLSTIRDDASLQSCWQIAYADAARTAGLTARAVTHEGLAVKEAKRSDNGLLKPLRKPAALKSWCKKNWPEINISAVGKYDSTKFSKDGRRRRSGSGSGGGGINLPGRGW